MVDATPDVAHVEQTSFVLRYQVKPGIIECGDSSNEYEMKERFLRFVDCNDKTGKQIVDMIVELGMMIKFLSQIVEHKPMTMVLTCLENTMGLNVTYWTEIRCVCVASWLSLLELM